MRRATGCRAAAPALLLTAASAAACSCVEAPGPAPAVPEGLVLEVDGLRIWQHEVEPLQRYFTSIDSRAGKSALLGGILDNALIPLKLAQRELAEPRTRLRELAEGLARAVGNEGYPGLLYKGRAIAGEPRERPMGRNDLPAPLAAWAFDPQNIGLASPVIETPQGFSLIATEHIDRGNTRADDHAWVYQVAFNTHDAEAFGAWYLEARRQLAGKVTYAHPDYRRALPPWIR